VSSEVCQDVSDLIRSTNGAVKQRTASHWSPNRHQVLIMLALSLISFMVALDACIIVTSLNVGLQGFRCHYFNTDDSSRLLCLT
jgi:uncharacterized membrane protein